MDIDMMIRINALAKELVQKGVAGSSEEGAKMAQQMLQKTAVEEKPIARTYSTASEAQPQPKEAGQPMRSDALEQYEILLERLGRKFEREMNELKGQLQNVHTELSQIRMKLQAAPKAPQPHPAPREARVEMPERAGERREEKKPAEAQAKPFVPSDVSIEKMFYFGKKE